MKHKLWFNMVRRKGRWIKMGWKLYTWNQTCPKTWPATWSWITGHHCAEASQSCKLIVGEMDLARHPLSAQVQNRGFDCNFCTHQELGGLKCQPPPFPIYISSPRVLEEGGWLPLIGMSFPTYVIVMVSPQHWSPSESSCCCWCTHHYCESVDAFALVQLGQLASR
jgi:hypothetical protein